MKNSLKTQDIIQYVGRKLNEAGIFDEYEKENLVAYSIGTTRVNLAILDNITNKQLKIIKRNLKKRIKFMPISKIIKSSNFYGYDFYVNKHVLSPRCETELIVEKCIETIINLQNREVNILDLCCGSGCIGITLKLELKKRGINCNLTLSDISLNALKVASKNAKAMNVSAKIIKSNMFKSINDKFDLIVSNPPYLKTNKLDIISKEVKNFDPMIALNGGQNGLKYYEIIANQASQFLNKDGILALEIAYDQAKEVQELLENNFKKIKLYKDLFNNDRALIQYKK